MIPSNLWNQSFYRIRKKVIALANQYWIEDAQGRQLGYTRQKIIRIKENVPVFSDESMSQELFRIVQEQIVDMWGTFAVVDTPTNTLIGKIRRNWVSEIGVDEYQLFDAYGRQYGRVYERAGRGLLRKYVPGGKLVPEQVIVEYMGQPVAEIKQQFKIIGDIWEVDCSRIPPELDRRTLLGAMILMGVIERDRK